MYSVIDASRWQGDIDFAKVKESGIYGVIIKCASSANIFTVDSHFEENYKKAKAAGLKVGAYFFSYDCSAGDAKQSAKRVAELLKGKQFELPVFYDIENANETQKNMAPYELVEMVRAFCKTLESYRFFVGVYSYASLFIEKLNAKELAKEFVLWVADYRESADHTLINTAGLWQYTSKGTVNGISGPVDLNYMYRDFAEIQTLGFNGFSSAGLKIFTATVTEGDLQRLIAVASEPGKEFGYEVT